MRYVLHAMIAREEVLEPIVEQFGHTRPVLLDGAELVLLPLCRDLFDEVRLDGFHVEPDSGFERLSSGVAAVITAASRRGVVAYLEADYTGDLGHQTAAVWLDCQTVFGPELLVPGEDFPRNGESPICRALRYFGVQAVGRSDEFVVLGLGRHRDTEHWCAAGARL